MPANGAQPPPAQSGHCWRARSWPSEKTSSPGSTSPSDCRTLSVRNRPRLATCPEPYRPAGLKARSAA